MKLFVIVIVVISVAGIQAKSTYLTEELRDLLNLIEKEENEKSYDIERAPVVKETDDTERTTVVKETDDAENTPAVNETDDSAVQTSEEDSVEEEVRYTQHDSYRCKRGNVDFQRSNRDAVMYAHNQLRARHGVDPYVWDEDLAKESQEYANWMAQHELLVHSPTHSQYGENIGNLGVSRSVVYGSPPFIRDMYNEMITNNWNFNTSSGNGTGHFTQIVWASSKYLGCGLATVKVKKWTWTYLCCRYKPAGNVNGQHAQNVFPPQVMELATDEDVDIDHYCDYSGSCHKGIYVNNCATSDSTRSICMYTCKDK